MVQMWVRIWSFFLVLRNEKKVKWKCHSIFVEIIFSWTKRTNMEKHHSIKPSSGVFIPNTLISINHTIKIYHPLINCHTKTGHKKAIELMLQKGVNVNAVENRWNLTPLLYIAVFDFSNEGHNDWTEDDRFSNFKFIPSVTCFFL